MHGAIRKSSRLSDKQNSEEDKLLIQKIKQLTEETSGLQVTPDQVSSTATRLNNYIREAEGLAATAYEPLAGAAASTTSESTVVGYDGEFVSSAGHTLSKLSNAMQLSDRVFTVEKFAEQFKRNMGCHERKNITKTMWKKLGRDESHIIGSVPIFRFLYGSKDFKPAEGVAGGNHQNQLTSGGEDQKKRVRIDYRYDQNQVVPVINCKKLLSESEETVAHVMKLRDKMNRMYQKNDRRPIPYLILVLDTESFSQTVENIFHFTFLINKDMAMVSVIKMGQADLTVVTPLDDDDTSDTHDENDACETNLQVIHSFNRETYETWLQKLKDGPDRYCSYLLI